MRNIRAFLGQKRKRACIEIVQAFLSFIGNKSIHIIKKENFTHR